MHFGPHPTYPGLHLKTSISLPRVGEVHYTSPCRGPPLPCEQALSLFLVFSVKTKTTIREGFFSRLFLVPKEGGTFRSVIDLSFLNNLLENSRFQIESIHCLVYTSKRRLYDHPGSERRLFVTPSPQGLSKVPSIPLNTAPKIFTKLLKLLAAFLRKSGVRMILYLDDFLILGSTYQEAQSHTAMAVSLLESLGFTVNLESLIPTQIITFLGFVIDSTVEALSLPQEKVVKVKSLCLKEKVSQTMHAHQIASVLGTRESCCPAIWHAPLHF